MKTLVRMTIPASLGIFLLVGVGCGGAAPKVDPEQGEKVKQARINAYGQSGYTNAKGGSGGAGPTESQQAAARRKAMGGH